MPLLENIKSSTVTLMVTEQAAAVTFYTDLMGLKLKAKYGEHYAEVEAPGIVIGLHPAAKAGEVGTNMSVGFMIHNFNDVVAGYTTKGISFEVMNDGWSRLALFQDPDRNALYLAEAKW